MVEIFSMAAYRLLLLLLVELWVADVVVAETEVEVEVEVVRRRGRPLRFRLPPPVRKWNLETIVETRLRMDMDMDDWELDEAVEGECLRRGGESLRASRVGRGETRGKAVRIKAGGIIALVDGHWFEKREREKERVVDKSSFRPRACHAAQEGGRRERSG